MKRVITMVQAAAIAAFVFGCGDPSDDTSVSEHEDPSVLGELDPAPPERSKAYDGQSCARNADCLSNECSIFAIETTDSFGRCTRGCDDDSDCVGETPDAVTCVGDDVEFSGVCEPTCRVDTDCGNGEICILSVEGQLCGFDYHDVYGLTRSGFGNAPEMVSTPLDQHLPPLRCNAEEVGHDWWDLTFEVPEDAISLMLWVETEGGYLIEISKDSNDFDYTSLFNTEFYSYSADEGGFVDFFTGLGEVDSIIQPGSYSLTIESELAPCIRVYAPTQLGSRIDLNLYNMSSYELYLADDERHSVMEETIALASALLNQSGLQIGKVRIMPVSESQREDFQYISDLEHHADMLASVGIEELADDEKRSINLFLINAYSEELNYIGLAGMVPGTPDNKGTSGGGISVRLGEWFGERVDMSLAQTLAHEIGHFLGLQHTSKHHDEGDWNWTEEDFLNDTPACHYVPGENVYEQDCPDADNLMFGHGAGTELTPGQRRVMRSNPLVY